MLRTIQNQHEKHNISSLSRVQGKAGTGQETMSLRWVGSSRINTQQRSLRDYPEWNGSMFLKLNWGLLTEETRLSSLLQHHQQCWGVLLRRTVWLVGTSANISAMWYSPRFHQRSEQLMQRESRTSGKLLLPVSRRPSHQEIASQRNNEAPSRISNRTSPWWFTRQTVALLLCYWILTHTMPWHRSPRLHCLSSATVTRPTTSAKNYQRTFTSWVHVRSC